MNGAISTPDPGKGRAGSSHARRFGPVDRAEA